jgi:hypothetical protein
MSPSPASIALVRPSPRPRTASPVHGTFAPAIGDRRPVIGPWADARCARRDLTAFFQRVVTLDILSHPVLVLEVRVDVKSL